MLRRSKGAMVVRVLSTVLLMQHLGDNGVTMASMRMARVIIVARPRRATGVVMPDRVMERLKDRFMALQEALSRGLLALIIGREVVTMVIVVVAVGETVAASILLRRLLWNRRPPRRWMPSDRRRNCQVRLWMW